ncbi:hypothetical protein PUN28_014762 [Cardiocondyla obscurior]|uniref:Uncharacterized protein n=1 Tax=Cardiocondyla obscurior TaxID=286306 RepID=A0AAW2EXI4_9HYME
MPDTSLSRHTRPFLPDAATKKKRRMLQGVGGLKMLQKNSLTSSSAARRVPKKIFRRKAMIPASLIFAAGRSTGWPARFPAERERSPTPACVTRRISRIGSRCTRRPRRSCAVPTCNTNVHTYATRRRMRSRARTPRPVGVTWPPMQL